jgi:hypothetical protein
VRCIPTKQEEKVDGQGDAGVKMAENTGQKQFAQIPTVHALNHRPVPADKPVKVTGRLI